MPKYLGVTYITESEFNSPTAAMLSSAEVFAVGGDSSTLYVSNGHNLVASSGDPAPTIDGVLAAGQTLRARLAPGWTASGYVWRRDGTPISGATSVTYAAQAADVLPGVALTVEATGLSRTSRARVAAAAARPETPVAPVLTALAAAISVAYTAPVSSTTILESQFLASTGAATNLTGSPQTISAAVGTAISGRVRFRNAQGWSDYSPQSNSVTPASAALREFNTTDSFAQGDQVVYAGGVYNMTAAHPPGNWNGNDATYLRQSGTRVLNTVGFSKPLGIVGNWVSGTMANTTTTVAAGTRGAKCQMEAPFTKLRIVRYQREAAPVRGLAVSVASTETDSVSGISNSVDPIVGGVAYNVLRANSPYGFARVTWSGQPRSPVQAPGGVSPPGQGYMTNLSTAISDWVDCNSVPPLPGKLPMVVMRYNDLVNAGDAGSSASQGTLGAFYNAYLAGTPTARFLFAPGVGAGDHVADPTLSRSAATMYDPALYNSGFWANIGIAAEHNIPTRVFAGFGDSITEGYSWWQNAVYLLSTQKAPCYVANFGCSTNRSAQYLEVLKTQLREENYFTDVILPSFSPNEVQSMTNTLADGFIAGLQDAIELCRVYNKRLYIWTSYAQYTTRYAANSTSVNAIKRINDWVRTEAAKAGALFNLIEIADGWDNASMIVTVNSDNTHPNAAAGIPYMTSRCLPAIQLGA